MVWTTPWGDHRVKDSERTTQMGDGSQTPRSARPACPGEERISPGEGGSALERWEPGGPTPPAPAVGGLRRGRLQHCGLAALMLERQDRAGHLVPVPPVVHERRVADPARVL